MGAKAAVATVLGGTQYVHGYYYMYMGNILRKKKKKIAWEEKIIYRALYPHLAALMYIIFPSEVDAIIFFFFFFY